MTTKTLEKKIEKLKGDKKASWKGINITYGMFK